MRGFKCPCKFNPAEIDTGEGPYISGTDEEKLPETDHVRRSEWFDSGIKKLPFDVDNRGYKMRFYFKVSFLIARETIPGRCVKGV